MRFYATVPMGLEEISSKEIEELGGRILGIRKGKGRVFFEGDRELVPKLNFFSRTLERVLILIENTHIDELKDIYRCMKSLDYSFIKPYQSFAIRSLRVGEHEFTSMDISREAGQGVIDSYMLGKGHRLRVDLDNPDVIIRVDLIHDELFVGLDTTGDNALHKRWYRVYNHPAPLNTAIASSMIRLSGWMEGKILLDPMCGGGTIPIEAAMKMRDIPPGKNREFAYFNFMGKILPDYAEKEVFSPIYGFDKFRKHVNGAIENSREAGVLDTIKFMERDFLKVEDFEANFIITNPPYGMRVGKKRFVEELYNGLFERATNVLEDDSILVLITPHRGLVEEITANLGFTTIDALPTKYGNLDTTIFKLKI
ncbi:MAG: class I SAM-dependent RNA methyltransferase [Thermoplasmata archaeon]|nr:MAG: class I SAM-dependent RNA methyltransferase [Thermoplasmata archaeon]